MCLKVNAEILQATGAVAPFVAEVWGLVGDNKLPAVADDQVLSVGHHNSRAHSDVNDA